MIVKWQQRLGNHDNLLFITCCAGILQIGIKSHKVLYNHRDNHHRVFGALGFVHRGRVIQIKFRPTKV
jgi:hypothetical protein